MTIETPLEAYARGMEMGRIGARLDNHDSQFASLDILLGKMVDIESNLSSTVQTLTEARVTDAATRVATAEAVKEAKLAQEAQAKSTWTPLGKFIVVAASLVGVIGLVWGILSSLPTTP